MKNKKINNILKFTGVLFLIFCIAITGYAPVNAAPNSSKYYKIEAETLQWKYDGNELWRSPNMIYGHVGVWQEMEMVPGANYAVSMTITAPAKATISPTSAGNSVSVFRKNAVSADHKDDGVRIAVFLNDTKIYPTDRDWAPVGETLEGLTQFALPEITMGKGDKLRYIIDCGGAGNNAYDAVYLNAEGIYKDETGAEVEYISFSQGLAYKDDAAGNDPSGIGNYTKKQLLTYEAVSVKEGTIKNDVGSNSAKVQIHQDPLQWTTLNDAYFWCGATTANDTYLYYDHNANGDFLTPGATSSVAVVFTAPSDGTIDNSFGLGSFYRTLNGNEPNDGTSDGARLTVIKNNTVVYPQSGYWADAPQEGSANFAPKEITFNSIRMKKGDKIYYIVDNGGNNNNSYDAVRIMDWGFLWVDAANPSGVWVGIGENFYNASNANQASSIPGYTRKDIISYMYTTVEELNPVGPAQDINPQEIEPFTKDQFVPMVWKPESGEKGEFRIQGDGYLIVSEYFSQPSTVYMLGIKWTAEQSGRLDISNSYIQNFLFQTAFNTSNGVRYKVILNNTKQILPDASGTEWIMTNQTEKSFLNIPPFKVEAGDEVLVVIDCNKQLDYDTLTAHMIFDFAADGAEHTKRYNNIKSLYDADSAFTYYGILIPLSSDRYFGTNVTELPVFDINTEVSGLGGIIIGAAIAVVVLAAAATTTVIIIKKKKKG